MRAEIIAIGDELTSGQRLDTNSQWLSERLGELGVPVAFHTTVGDDLETNVAAFRNAIDRCDIVVATGGLGPTADDLTRDALATAAGVDLVQDDAALAHICALFARRNRPMPERNVVQAHFPRGSQVVPNPNGTAPGIDMTLNRPSPAHPRDGEGFGEMPCRVFALPGVPAEMFEMWKATVAPAIAAMLGSRRVIRHHRIKVFGAGESDVEAMLPDMIRRKREPLVGITVSDATITLRITASGPDDAACRQTMAPTIAEAREILGVLVFGEEDDELEHAVVRLLNERNQTVAVAEWATDGLVSRWLAEAAAGSGCFRGGVVASDATMLNSILGTNIDAEVAAAEATSASMAELIRRKANADFGLATAAFPTATDLRDSAMTGTLHVALASGDKVRTKGFPVAAHPAIIKPRSAKNSLNMLRLAMLNTSL
jgi:nicotinamide-nucleotide amidase